MTDRTAGLPWGAAFALLVALAVPWFLWRDATVVAGLPAWVWWHVAWMVVAAATFAAFADRAWGLGVETGRGGGGASVASASAAGPAPDDGAGEGP